MQCLIIEKTIKEVEIEFEEKEEKLKDWKIN